MGEAFFVGGILSFVYFMSIFNVPVLSKPGWAESRWPYGMQLVHWPHKSGTVMAEMDAE